MEHPIDNVQWKPTTDFRPNEYNPNRVLSQELGLLKFSILSTGWVQPVLCGWNDPETEDFLVIIDGYHRWWLTAHDKECGEFTGGKVPCVIMDLPVPERMLLTVRINRAKGVHQALDMAGLIKTVVNQYGYARDVVAQSIGADISEIDLLLTTSIFEQKDTKNTPYSQAWVMGRDDGSLYKK